MPINSKKKGKVGELEVAHMLNSDGFGARRSAQFCGNNVDGAADIVGLPYIHVEVKRVESLNVENAMEQARRDHKSGFFPAVFHRRNNEKWKVTMDYTDWIQIYREYYSSRVLTDQQSR